MQVDLQEAISIERIALIPALTNPKNLFGSVRPAATAPVPDAVPALALA